MSVSIRLSKFGKTNAPTYRVVVTKTKTKRRGKFIDILGFYNPLDKTTEFTMDKKKYDEWVSKGAIVSDAVKKLVDGTYEFVKYDPKAKAKEEEAKAAAKEKEAKETEETVEEEKKDEKSE